MTNQEQIEQNKQWHRDDWLRLYRSVTDPDMIANGKREAEKKQRLEQKRKDVGL